MEFWQKTLDEEIKNFKDLHREPSTKMELQKAGFVSTDIMYGNNYMFKQINNYLSLFKENKEDGLYHLHEEYRRINK